MRPPVITVLSVILIIMGSFQLIGVISGFGKIDVMGTVWVGVSNLAFLASIYGLWRMKVWGPVLFIGLVIVNGVIVFVVQPDWVFFDKSRPWVFLILPAIYLFAVLPYWKRFSSNKRVERDAG